MSLNERDVLNRLIYGLRDQLLPFISSRLVSRYGRQRTEQIFLREARPRNTWNGSADSVDPQDTIDTYALLKMIRANWDEVFKENVREADRWSLRSYASLLESARHLTAHQEPFDAEDVIFFVLTAERLSNLIPSSSEWRVSLREMKCNLIGLAYRDIIVELVPLPAPTEPQISLTPAELRALTSQNEAIQSQINEIRHMLLTQQERSHAADTESNDEEIDEYLGDDDEDEIEDYFDIPVTVRVGPYVDALTITDGTYTLTRGVNKFRVISAHEFTIRDFAVTGQADPGQIDLFYGHPILCLPNVRDRRIGFTQPKARMIIAAMPEINEWLELYDEDDSSLEYGST